MIISRIGRRGQMTVPKPIRESLGLKEGDHVVFLEHGDQVVLQPMNKTLLDLRGMVAVSGPQDFTAIRQQVREQRAHERIQGCEE